MGREAAGVDGSGEGAWTLATPAEGFLAASGAGELAHLLVAELILTSCWYLLKTGPVYSSEQVY